MYLITFVWGEAQARVRPIHQTSDWGRGAEHFEHLIIRYTIYIRISFFLNNEVHKFNHHSMQHGGKLKGLGETLSPPTPPLDRILCSCTVNMTVKMEL